MNERNRPVERLLVTICTRAFEHVVWAQLNSVFAHHGTGMAVAVVHDLPEDRKRVFSRHPLKPQMVPFSDVVPGAEAGTAEAVQAAPWWAAQRASSACVLAPEILVTARLDPLFDEAERKGVIGVALEGVIDGRGNTVGVPGQAVPPGLTPYAAVGVRGGTAARGVPFPLAKSVEVCPSSPVHRRGEHRTVFVRVGTPRFAVARRGKLNDELLRFELLHRERSSPPVETGVVKVLICVAALAGGKARRDAARGTWASDLPDGCSYVFIGSPEGAEPDGEFDSNLIEASGAPGIGLLARIAGGRPPAGCYFLCDDRCYPEPTRLLRLLQGVRGLVVPMLSRPARRRPWAAGIGASPKGLETLAQAGAGIGGSISDWTSEPGVELSETPLLQTGHGVTPSATCPVANAYRCTPSMMREIKRDFSTGLTSELFRAEARMWSGLLELRSDGEFRGGGARPGGRWRYQDDGSLLILDWSHWPATTLRAVSDGVYEGRRAVLRRV